MTTVTAAAVVALFADMIAMVGVVLVFNYVMVHVHFGLLGGFLRFLSPLKHLHFLLIHLIKKCSRMLENRDCGLAKVERRRL